jgi:arylsulfatase A-like enzyme
MKPRFNRRDFLKLAGLSPLSLLAPRLARMPAMSQPLQSGQKNVIVVVFDAFSAHNISLYGYKRATTPNLTRLAERAVVYHNHFAGGNFTTPGTASLLTGVLPWTHRAFALNTAVDAAYADKNIFRAFKNYYRIAYSHNNVVNTLLKQFQGDVDELIPQRQLYLTNDGFINTLFSNDDDIASVSWTRIIKKQEYGYSYSLFISRLYELLRDSQFQNLKSLFPRGIPGIQGDNYFLLEDAIQWLGGQVGAIPQPFFGYFHFLPPHYPYRTEREFYGRFAKDGYKPVKKPMDMFSQDKSPDNGTVNTSDETLLVDRTSYDEFILYADREFGKFFDKLESSGQLENTVVVLTSDHGEMFERGIEGHSTAVLYQPVIHVPLLVFDPGRKQRLDIYTPTSAVDVMPTLLHLAGQPAAGWGEGILLPPFGPTDAGRSIHTIQARGTARHAPIKEATITHVKWPYKLTCFFGYKRLEVMGERVELYNVEADPQELVDLYASQPEIAASLLAELKAKLAEADKPYL